MLPTTCNPSQWHRSGSRDILQADGHTLGYVEELRGSGALVACIYDRTGRRHQRPFRDNAAARSWVADNAAAIA